MGESKKKSWDDIPEVEPDEWDRQMLEDMKNDPDCHEYVSFDEAMTILGLDKNEITSEEKLKAAN